MSLLVNDCEVSRENVLLGVAILTGSRIRYCIGIVVRCLICLELLMPFLRHVVNSLGTAERL